MLPEMSEPMPITDLLRRAALRYAEEGWPVVPLHSPNGTACDCRKGAACESPAKHPRTLHGLKDASTSLGIVDAWWRQWPNANIGLVLPRDIVAVDIDSPDALDGFDEHPDWTLPETWNVTTGKGWHYIYRTPEPIKGTVGIMPGIDLRGHGNYLVAPPSMHANGTRYKQNSSMAFIAAAPAWISEQRPASTAPLGSDEAIPQGRRDNTLLQIGGAMRRFGVDEGTILATLRAENARRCSPPLPDADVRRIAHSAAGYAPEPVPFRIAGIEDPQDAPDHTVGMDAADLLALELPPLRWAVRDLLPEGTTILAAPPKVGKSCLVYQIAVEVSLGGELLGREVEGGSALYLALEDGKRRGQARLLTALTGRTMPRDRLEVRWGSRRIGKGLEDDLRAWLDDHPDARMVAIDTLQKVRAAGTGKRGAYEVDVEDLGRLQDLFRDRPCALLIVHHARKATSDDFLTSVSGTYGITGSADTIIVIKRTRLEAFGQILVTGRDIDEIEIPVSFDEMLWHLAPASMPEASFERAEVYRVIEEHGPIFPAAIAERLNLGRVSVQNMCSKMVDKGDIVRTIGGYQVARVDLAYAQTVTD